MDKAVSFLNAKMFHLKEYPFSKLATSVIKYSFCEMKVIKNGSWFCFLIFFLGKTEILQACLYPQIDTYF